MTSSTFAATDDIGLYVKDIIIGWNGGGGTKDVEHNAFSYNQYAENYWDIHDLSTNVYDGVEFAFAQAVNYDNISVVATYSDGSATETKITKDEPHRELRCQQDTRQDCHHHRLGRSQWFDYHLLQQHRYPCQGFYWCCRYDARWLAQVR